MRPSQLRFVVLALVIISTSTGCAPTPNFGTLTPTREICSLGGFDQSLALAPDFHIDRIGQDAYLSDAQFRAKFQQQAAEVTKFSKCSGRKQIGRVDYKLRRLEAGSSRGGGMKILMWTLFLIPTLGLSSIYPLTETRWLTLEVDAQIFVGSKLVWRGELSSHTKLLGMGAPLQPTGQYLSDLMKKIQERAVAELGQLVPKSGS